MLNITLLIVPYGIETRKQDIYNRLMRELLIVPYGIETDSFYDKSNYLILLIVPYGIETWK